GSGSADLRDARVESIKNSKLQLYVDFAGRVKSQARGKQIGFDYTADPDIGVSLKDRLQFVVEPSAKGFQLRVVPKKLNMHLDIVVRVPMIGKDVNSSRDVEIDSTAIIKPIDLPTVLSPNVTFGKNRKLVLKNFYYRAESDRMQFAADLNFEQKE
ncbi:MAG: hypothetical protein JNN15_02970, partial [Blastocatellia bacterium]|nr:hypothetical protein [Blastocatellia bacterium]